jgi:hypothetical protein
MADQGFENSPNVRRVLEAVSRWPGVVVDLNEPAGRATISAGADEIGRVDLRRGEVVVNAPADVLPTMQRTYPNARPVADGMLFEVAYGNEDTAALAALRRRANVERLSWQTRNESP